MPHKGHKPDHHSHHAHRGDAAVDVPTHVQTFIRLHATDAIAASRKYDVPVGVILAQSGLETSFGTRVKENTCFGVKGKSAAGSATFSTHEVVKGKSVTVKDDFRAFGSYREAVEDYCMLLTSKPQYVCAFAFKGRSVGFAEQIGRSGYATDPRYGQSWSTSSGGTALTPLMLFTHLLI